MTKQRSVRPLSERFWAKVDKRSDHECWPWTAATNGRGYGLIGGGRRTRNLYAHRVSLMLAGTDVPDGAVVRHTCDNPPCVNPLHLQLGTAADNARDMVVRRRSLYGERHNCAQLSEDDVLAIRRAWAEGGVLQRELAEQFNTTAKEVSLIVRGRRWKHLLPTDWVPPTPHAWSRS